MTWERDLERRHRCVRPILAVAFASLAGVHAGDVWICDECGRRHPVVRRSDGTLMFGPSEKRRTPEPRRYCAKCGAAEDNHGPGGSRFGVCTFELDPGLTEVPGEWTR